MKETTQMKVFEMLPRPLGPIFRKLTHFACNSPIEKCHLVARGLGNGGGRYGLAELYFGIMAARVGFVYNVDRGYEEKFYQRWCRHGSDARACIGQWRQEAMV